RKPQKFQINIIDTPGHVDFTAEVERSLRVLDGAIAIFDAVGGVEPQTETVWKQAERYKVPCIGYVNKMDRIGADFFFVLTDIKNKLGITPAAIQIPIGKESGFEGLIDLISMEELHFSGSEGETVAALPIAPERAAEAAAWREALIDALSGVSDAVTEAYLSGSPVPEELLRAELRQAVLHRRILPVLAGASRRNMGVQPLIDAVVDYLPSPLEAVPATAFHLKKEEEVEIPCDPASPPLGLVFKIQNDREAGSLCYVRMYAGKLTPGAAVFNQGKKKRERINRILRMHSNKSEPVDELCAGDIGALIGLKLAQTGDTIGSEGFPALLEQMRFPEPVISVAIEPGTASERDRLKEVLAILSKEDPTFTSKENDDTGQLIISGMGELHIDVLVSRIIKEFKVEARVGTPQVTYRESITAVVEKSMHFSRILAGKENAAAITLRLEPLERGSGNRYVKAVRAPDVPSEIFEAVERGVMGALSSGISLGYPCIDVRVTLTALEFSPLTGTPFAFEACAGLCFDEAACTAGPVLLEPVMALDLSSPNEFTGEAISLLTQRGGQVESINSTVQGDEIKASAPMAKMFGFMTPLRSVSQGRAHFTMTFSRFEKKAGK
ncbi:MAG: GTP-binding protein, partial [Spirochaetaceae bacterium]|nr:GTP-binding protein [Spirochaetaceae bacterium]